MSFNAYERSAKARAACLKEHGYHCSVCELLFVEVYGKIGVNFIHVHHTNPVAARRKRYKLNPKTDLIPVCPNCHAMVTRQQSAINSQPVAPNCGATSQDGVMDYCWLDQVCDNSAGGILSEWGRESV